MCTGTRRHARFRIAFVELIQYENHRFLHFGNNERLPKLRIRTPVPLFRDQQALRRFGNRLLARKDPNGRTGSDDEQLFDKKGLFYFQPMASYYIPLGKKFYYVPRFYIGFGFGKNKSELTSKEVSEEDASRFRVGISALNFEFRPADRIGIMFNAGDLGYQTTVIKQDGDNKVSNRDFSLGLNVGATIAFNYYF